MDRRIPLRRERRGETVVVSESEGRRAWGEKKGLLARRLHTSGERDIQTSGKSTHQEKNL